MKTRADRLLEGAIDLHYHCYPEFSYEFQPRLDDQETLELARQTGMRGVVLKSHIWPTVGRADYLRRLVPGIEAFASICLNSSSGGLSLWAVESAALQGARVVWMPTWNAASVANKGGVTGILKKYVPSLETAGPGLTILDGLGEVLPVVKQILAMARKHRLVISTGHLSPAESLKLAEEARDAGVGPLIFCHPLSASIQASMEEIRRMAGLNCLIEFCALDAFFVGKNLKETIEVIEAIGPGKCLLSTDSFRFWRPPGPELLRMFIGALLEAGVSEDGIEQMVKTNPARLLGI
ncbi:MAG: hypothetical protein HY673_25790 [Chloroflexi bacterium]|nr:hypothetical protein [Chloroflexota bacterium]